MDVAAGQMGIHSDRSVVILGIDPGKNKTGWAFVDKEGNLCLSGIILTSDIHVFKEVCGSSSDVRERLLEPWIIERRKKLAGIVEFVAVGKGTGSRDAVREMRNIGCSLMEVDEKNTTLMARTLYWNLHAPSLWQRFLPRFLRVPPRPLDDLAAWAIALRGIGLRTGTDLFEGMPDAAEPLERKI